MSEEQFIEFYDSLNRNKPEYIYRLLKFLDEYADIHELMGDFTKSLENTITENIGRKIPLEVWTDFLQQNGVENEKKIIPKNRKINLKKIADDILNNSLITISEHKYRICEIEFYIYTKGHEDNYTHKADEQKTSEKWYFHRRGKSYKEGTYKGLDITMGNDKTFMGILIRSLYNQDSGKFIEGPCNCVNALIHPCQKVSEFIGDLKIPLSVLENPKKLHLEKVSGLKQEKIYRGKRYGLSEKYPEWRDKKYRFLIMKNFIKKQKSDLEEVIIGNENLLT